MTDAHRVIVTREAEAQLSQLVEEGAADVVLAALQLAKQLRSNPYLGDQMRARPNFAGLADCRRILFDAEGRKGKPRYRLVYLNEPEDGAPAIVAVLSVGERAGLEAYKRANVALSRRRGRRRRRT